MVTLQWLTPFYEGGRPPDEPSAADFEAADAVIASGRDSTLPPAPLPFRRCGPRPPVGPSPTPRRPAQPPANSGTDPGLRQLAAVESRRCRPDRAIGFGDAAARGGPLCRGGLYRRLRLAGEPPLLMDMGAARGDVDHVVALFRRHGCWGAISKSNSPFLRYRDPIYRSLRELSLSFFPQYVKKRRKTLRTYSVSFDLRRVDPGLWVTHPGFCHQVVDALTAARHSTILPPGGDRSLRPIDEIEARSNLLRDPRGV